MRNRILTFTLATAAIAASTAVIAGGAQARVPWCDTSRMQLEVTAGDQLGSNLRTANITLRNMSWETCATQGYPGVDLSIWGGPGHHAVRNGAVGHPIELAPRQAATAVLTYQIFTVATDNFPDEITVTPPDNTESLRAYWDWRKLGAVSFDQSQPSIAPLRA
ncbi:hypothetical protein JMUB6875_67110 [Nocardia sp. JMUB6875]|uniref:DUF4232 domain-containing protein n=1 Tax=Nocardia sp. JMUB6875 TaxID=3158170 RepID=UPI0032E54045